MEGARGAAPARLRHRHPEPERPFQRDGEAAGPPGGEGPPAQARALRQARQQPPPSAGRGGRARRGRPNRPLIAGLGGKRPSSDPTIKRTSISVERGERISSAPPCAHRCSPPGSLLPSSSPPVEE